MRMSVAVLLACMTLTLAGSAASGTTYYVATTGSDTTGDGSSANPWASIQHAVDATTDGTNPVVIAGDTIIVRDGAYVGARIDRSGAPGAPITLKAEHAGQAHINTIVGNSRMRHGSMLEIEKFYPGHVEYWVVDGFDVDGSEQPHTGSHYGIDVRSDAQLSQDQQGNHITIMNCNTHNAWRTGIFSGFVNYLDIENNTTHDNSEHGIYNSNSGDYGCNRGNAIYSNVGASIQNNADWSSGGDGIMDYWVHERNLCHDNGNGLNFSGLEWSTARNNLLYKVGKGVTYYGGSCAVTANNNRFVNNTVVLFAGTGYYDVLINDDAGLTVKGLGMRIFNNILYHYTNSSGRGSICVSSSSLPDFQSDYNVVMHYFALDDNGSQMDISAWRVRALDTHSVEAATGSDVNYFVNPSTYDYHLLSASPARDAGTALYDVAEDLEGNARPAGPAYDIGCYEYGASPAGSLSIATTSFPHAYINNKFGTTPAATGGTTPYAWSVAGGSLPAGLSIIPFDGLINGVPTTAGASNFTLMVTDGIGTTATQALSLVVDTAPLAITTSMLPNARKDAAYTQYDGVTPVAVAVVGGSGGYTWTLNGGNLPAGLSLGSSTGAISGTATATGASSFTVRVADSFGLTAQRGYSIYVSEQMAVFQDGLNGYSGTTDVWLNSDYPTANYGSDSVNVLQWATADRQLRRFDVSSIPIGSVINSATISFWAYGFSGTPTASCYRVLTSWDEMQATFQARLTGVNWGLAGLQPDVDYVSTALGSAPINTAGQWVSIDITSAVQGWVNTAFNNYGVMYRLTAAGRVNCTMRESDNSPNRRRPMLVVNYTAGSGIAITSGTLPPDTVNIPYNQTLTVTGGTSPYTWSIIGGSLPAGLSLAPSTGVISGTPTVAGASSFTAQVTDTLGLTATQTISILINAANSITTASLAAGSVGAAYSQTLARSGGTSPYTWSIPGGSLPAGLSLASSTGVISGTPTATGTSSFTAMVTDGVGATATAALSIAISYSPLVVSSINVPNGCVDLQYLKDGTPHNVTLVGAGGLAPYTWSISGGSLPTGLSLNASTGDITGTPTAKGTFNFTATVTDGQPVSAQKAFSVFIGNALFQRRINNGYDAWLNSDDPDTNHGAEQVNKLQYATADRQVHKFDISAIPPGATINRAVISFYAYQLSGTPTVKCYSVLRRWDELQATWNSRLTGTAWGAGGLQSGTDYDATEIGTVVMSPDLASSLAVGQWSKFDITSTVQAWVNGSHINEGVMYVETTAGTCWTAMCDSPGRPEPMLVMDYSGGSLAITTSSLPAGTVGAAYNQTLTAAGGTLPYTWSLSGGSLPAGLSLNGSTGAVSGTPSAIGTSSFTLAVTDNVFASATKALSIAINPAPLAITTSSLPGGTTGSDYSQTLVAAGGVTPYAWSLASGSLPEGLSLTSGGVMSGTPTGYGTANFTVQVTDSQSTPATATKALSILVSPPAPIITTSSLPGAQVGVAYSQALAVVGGTSPYTWSIASGGLPDGLSLTSDTGAISGTPTTSGVASFTVQVADSDTPAATATKALSITVNAEPKTYYVDPAGNDANDGSSGTPWLTIQHAVDTVIGGDTIIVNAGTYAGARIRYSGAAGQIKTLKVATGATVLINTPGALCTKPSCLEVKADTLTDGVAYWLIDGFEITSSPNYNVEIQYGDHVTVQNCKIHNGTANNVVMWMSNYCSLLNNEVYSNTGGSSMYIGEAGDYCVLRGNSVHNAASNAIFLTSDNGIGDKLQSNWMIEKNKCYTNGSRMMLADGLVDSVIRNNLAYNQVRALDMIGQNSAATCNNNRILNNTLVNLTGGYYTVFIHTATGGLPAGTNNAFFNNILYSYNTNAGRGTFCIDSSAQTGFQSDYNVVMNIFALDDNATQMDLTGWRALGYDLHSRQAADTALFVNPAGFDFHLKNDSPARDAGTTLTDVTDDSEGAARPQGAAYDIGCYEYHVTIAPLAISTTTLPAGQTGALYSQTLAATGGTTPYSWSVISGSLPAGLSLTAATGAISGTPSASGTVSFTVRVSDSQSTPATATAALSISVNPLALSITTSSLPGGQVGVAYSQTVAATGGVTPYAWSIASGSLPAGLSLDASTGGISGTPTAYGLAGFTAQVVDGGAPAQTAMQALTINVVPTTLTITTTSLPAAPLGVAYNRTVTAAGGATPYAWSISSGGLPTGLSLNASTGTISGTPSAGGTFDFTAMVTDSWTPANSATKALSISVSSGASYQFVSNDSESSTTNTNYVGKAVLTFTPPAADDWIVFGFCEFRCPNASYATFVQLFIDGQGAGQNTRKPVDPTDYLPFVTVKVANLSAGPHTISLMYRAGNAAAAAYIRNARICVVRKAALEFYNVANDNAKALTINSTDIAALTWTPAITGNYLVISTAELNATTTVSTDLQTLYNGVLNDEGIMRAADNGDYTTFMSFNYLANAPAGVPITHKITGRKMATDPINHYIRRARILALRLSQGRFANTAAGYALEQNTTATTFQQCLTTTWTYGVNGNWLLLNGARLNNSSTSCQTEVRAQLNDTSICGQQLMKPRDVSDLLNYSSIDVRNLSTPRKVDMDWRTTNSGGMAKVKRLRFYGLPLDQQ